MLVIDRSNNCKRPRDKIASFVKPDKGMLGSNVIIIFVTM